MGRPAANDLVAPHTQRLNTLTDKETIMLNKAINGLNNRVLIAVVVGLFLLSVVRTFARR